MDKIDRVISVDQSPLGKTPRSNPATYTGIFSFIQGPFRPGLRFKGTGDILLPGSVSIFQAEDVKPAKEMD